MSITALPTARLAPLPHKIAQLDWSLVCLWLALMSIGLVMVSSASIGFAAVKYNDPWFFTKRHVIYLGIGAAAAVLVALVPLQVWRRYGVLLIIAAVVLLVLVFVPGLGRRVNGSQRWLVLGPITVQASEVVKFCAIIYFAGFFQRYQTALQANWKGLIKPLLLLGVLGGLLLLEPDFGSTVVLCATVVAMMFLAGIRLGHFALLLLAGFGALVAVAMVSPYRMQRLITFLDPWADQFNSGYQLTQSLIAFGRGEWFGVGLGNSVQKLLYLPEAHTDFIFAILAEEFGLIGALVVVGLFAALVWRILLLAKNGIANGDRFASFAAFGFAVLVAGQVFVNLGVASGLLPTKGLTLPFISYGGSSLVMCCAALGFLLRVDWEQRQTLMQAAQPEQKKPRRKSKPKAVPATEPEIDVELPSEPDSDQAFEPELEVAV